MQFRAACFARPMIVIDRAARGGTTPGIRAGSRCQPEDLALSHLPRHAVFRKQGAAQNACGGGLSLAGSGEASRRSTSRSRPVGSGSAAALYAPETLQIQAVREHIAANFHELRAIVESPTFKHGVGRLSGEQLHRVPRGFSRDHPAAAYLKYRQFLAGKEFPAAFATSPRFYRGILNVFRRLAPLARFLNEPLIGQRSQSFD